ncbi:MAG: GGDEF domain-containing protein [Proteobacteria bacterium]|nr:GGDEF domain-containing protein [Pseudomonadota bacterium]
MNPPSLRPSVLPRRSSIPAGLRASQPPATDQQSESGVFRAHGGEQEPEIAINGEALAALLDLGAAEDRQQARGALERATRALADDALAAQPMLTSIHSLVCELHKLRKLAGQDELSGAANRRAFNDALQRELARCDRSSHSVAVIMLDLDGLKGLNDTCGHAAGDAAIRTVARCCHNALRKSDLVARLGGDEFAILLPETDPSAARAVAERVRYQVEQSSVCGRQLRVSCGVAVSQGGQPRGQALVVMADQELYRDKRARRGLDASEAA